MASISHDYIHSTADPVPQSSLILYQTKYCQTRVQCRFEGESLWLSQALMAELFQMDVRTINEHLGNIYAKGELAREAPIRKFRIVRTSDRLRVLHETEYES